MSGVTLHGMTWSHPRGFDPMVATAARYRELNPGVEVVWHRRSLKAFEEFPVESLAARYDLIVIDHPFVGQASERGPILPLDEHLPADFLADQAASSVGASHASYAISGHQWALAIDAAAPVAFWREDLLAGDGLDVPRTWEETIELARAGRVEIPAGPIYCLMNFYALCAALGEPPFSDERRVVAPEVAAAALARLRELLRWCDPGCWARDPIASHDLAAGARNTRAAYCPLAYGYSNYARDNYAAHRLSYGEPPLLGPGTPVPSTLGGTGLAVSALRQHRAEAVAYARFVASPEIQRTLYAASGGQPGHRGAWTDPENNRLTHGYFERTLPALDRAYLRPRYSGYLGFQEKAGAVVHAALRGSLGDAEALERLDSLHRASRPHSRHP